jgi:hypothetical protein
VKRAGQNSSNRNNLFGSPSAPPLLQLSRELRIRSTQQSQHRFVHSRQRQVPLAALDTTEEELSLSPPENVAKVERLDLQQTTWTTSLPAEESPTPTFTMLELVLAVTCSAIGLGGAGWLWAPLLTFCIGLFIIFLIFATWVVRIPRLLWICVVSIYVSAGFATVFNTFFPPAG